MFSFLHFHHYVKGPAPTSGPYGSGQAPVQFPFQTSQMGLGGPPGPHVSEIDAYIYQMGQQMRPGHGRTQARSMTLAGNYVPHVAYPSSSYNPTSGPRMNESRSDMVNRHGLAVPTETRPYRNNSSRPSSFASESTLISGPDSNIDQVDEEFSS